MKALTVLVLAAVVYLVPGVRAIDWEILHPQPGLPPLRAVAFGEGRFVAAGDGGLFVSTDAGRTWRDATGAAASSYTAIAYGDGTFVAVGHANQAAVSADGETWQMHNIPGTNGFLSLVHGSGRWVAGGKNGAIASSADGHVWTVTNTASNLDIWKLAHGDGRFVATDGKLNGDGMTPCTMAVLVSTNGTDWSGSTATIPFVNPACTPSPRFAQPCAYFAGVRGLAFASGQFVALAGHSPTPGTEQMKTLLSADGLTWTLDAASDAGGVNFMSIRPENSLILANDRLLSLLTRTSSTNATSWTPLPLQPPYAINEFFAINSFFGAAYGVGTYLMVGTINGFAAIARSDDLASFERIDSPRIFFSHPESLASHGGVMVVAGSSTQSLIASMNGGNSWAPVSLPEGSGAIRDVHAAQEKLVAVGTQGTILRSTDGMAWTKRLSNTTQDLNSVAFGNGVWVAVGQSGRIVTSPDASFFQIASANTEINLHSVTFGDGLFVAVGGSGAILRSTNGQSWTIFGTDDAADLHAVAHTSGRFVAVGAGGIVHVSTNGVDWLTTRIPGAGLLSRAAAADGHFLVMEHDSGALHHSTHGLDWARVQAPRTVTSVDGSGGQLFAMGEGMFLARAVFDAPGERLRLSASLRQGSFQLSFDAPERGDFEVLSAQTLGGAWQLSATLTNISGPIVWTNRPPLEAAQFFIVRKK